MITQEEIQKYLEDIRKDESFVSDWVLEAIPYKNKDKNTWVEIEYPEFTSLCPRTGLPDFGIIRIRYLPDKAAVELKSLKYYFLQFRNCGIFYENLTQLILKNLAKLLHPFEMTIEASFTTRGGMRSKVVSTYKR